MIPDSSGPRLARLRRAEALLDRWLDLFEAALDDARPDPARTSELANVFTILKRIQEIETLIHRATEAARSHDHKPLFEPDPHLFGDGIPGGNEEDGEP